MGQSQTKSQNPPPTEPVSSTYPCCFPSNCKYTTLFYCLTTILVLAILSGVTYLNRTQKAITTPIPTITPPTSWNNYRGDSFNIAYPPDWFTINSGISNTALLFDNDDPKLLTKGKINIVLSERDTSDTLDIWFTKTLVEYKRMEGDSPYTTYSHKSNVLIANLYPSLQIVATGYGNLNYRDYYIWNKQNKGVIVSISYPYDEYQENVTLIDQILSTFRFLGSSSPIEKPYQP